LAELILQNPSAESGGIWGRVESIRKIKNAKSYSEIEAELSEAFNKYAAMNLTSQLARLTAPFIENLPRETNNDTADASYPNIARVLLLVGKTDAAHYFLGNIENRNLILHASLALQSLNDTTLWTHKMSDALQQNAKNEESIAALTLALISAFQLDTTLTGQYYSPENADLLKKSHDNQIAQSFLVINRRLNSKIDSKKLFIIIKSINNLSFKYIASRVSNEIILSNTEIKNDKITLGNELP